MIRDRKEASTPGTGTSSCSDLLACQFTPEVPAAFKTSSVFHSWSI
jgi:hypothetical protein